MSLLWPVDNPVVSGAFGNSPEFYEQYGQRGHNGIDLAVNLGTPVYAADGGWVVAEGWGDYDSWMGAIAGIFVRVGHAFGFTAYAHLSSTIVDVGQWVNRGQLIGYSGATGVGTGPHLHFETFPLFPDFGNGFAGRVNPAIYGLELRGPSPAPAPTPAPKPKDPDMHIFFDNARKTQQVIPVNKRTAITFRENHDDHPDGDRTIARGPLAVKAYAVQVTLEGGTPGKRVDLQLTRETGAGKNAKNRARTRDVFDSRGQFSKQLVLSGPLSKGQLVRAYVQTEAGGQPARVTEFYGTGYAEPAA